MGIKNGLTLKQKLVGMGVIGILMALLLGAVGYIGIGKVDSSMDGIVVAASALKNHLSADMMHDALRSDVLAAITFADSRDQEKKNEILNDLAEHSKLFRENLSGSEGLPLNEEVKKALNDIKPALDSYIKDAEELTLLAFKNRSQALSGLDKFFTVFETLEDEMSKLSDLIEKNWLEIQAAGDKATASSKNLIMIMSIITFLILLASVVVAFFISNAVGHALSEAGRIAEAVAGGDLTVRGNVTRKDETGRLAMALNNMADNLMDMIGQLQNSTGQISMTSGELAASSMQMGSNSEETSRQVSSVSAAGEQTNRNVQTVASAAEEMTATIKEISKNVQEASSITSQAVHVAESTNQTISKLNDSSAEIGKVVKVITSIAQQTNLLALNATIEAARAGEAGKGFAVVANEVKDLAKETAKATEEISQKIEAIQTDTKSAVSAIGEIGQIIGKINEISMTIAGAVEEQAATTTEISRNMAEAARGTSEVVQNITSVSTASKSTAEGAANVMAASKILSKMGEDLMEVAGRFKIESNGYGKTVRTQQRRQEKAELAAAS